MGIWDFLLSLAKLENWEIGVSFSLSHLGARVQNPNRYQNYSVGSDHNWNRNHVTGSKSEAGTAKRNRNGTCWFQTEPDPFASLDLVEKAKVGTGSQWGGRGDNVAAMAKAMIDRFNIHVGIILYILIGIYKASYLLEVWVDIGYCSHRMKVGPCL